MKTKNIVVIALILAVIVVAGYFLFRPKEIAVTFDSDNGNQIASVKVVDGKIQRPSDPVKEGYIFLGWYDGDDLFDFETEVTENISLKAKWEEETDDNAITVKFDSDGGTVINDVKVAEGLNISKPVDPTREGYTFVEWQLDGVSYDFDSKVTKDITLKAVWKENSTSETETVKYTVTFDSNGGSKVSSKTVTDGSSVSKPTNPTRSGYTFVEWQLAGKTYNFSSKVTSNITLKAVWKENSTSETETVKYTVTFDSNGGSNVDNKTVTNGSSVSKPTNPTRSGYTFVEWQLAGQTYDFNSKVTSNITLKAVWKEQVVTYSTKWVKVEESVADQYTLYIVDSNGNYVSGTVTVNFVDGSSQTSNIDKAGKMFYYKTTTIASVTDIKVN